LNNQIKEKIKLNLIYMLENFKVNNVNGSMLYINELKTISYVMWFLFDMIFPDQTKLQFAKMSVSSKLLNEYNSTIKLKTEYVYDLNNYIKSYIFKHNLFSINLNKIKLGFFVYYGLQQGTSGVSQYNLTWNYTTTNDDWFQIKPISNIGQQVNDNTSYSEYFINQIFPRQGAKNKVPVFDSNSIGPSIKQTQTSNSSKLTQDHMDILKSKIKTLKNYYEFDNIDITILDYIISENMIQHINEVAVLITSIYFQYLVKYNLDAYISPEQFHFSIITYFLRMIYQLQYYNFDNDYFDTPNFSSVQVSSIAVDQTALNIKFKYDQPNRSIDFSMYTEAFYHNAVSTINTNSLPFQLLTISDSEYTNMIEKYNYTTNRLIVPIMIIPLHKMTSMLYTTIIR